MFKNVAMSCFVIINVMVYYHYDKVDSCFSRDFFENKFFFSQSFFFFSPKEILKICYLPTQHLSMDNGISFKKKKTKHQKPALYVNIAYQTFVRILSTGY